MTVPMHEDFSSLVVDPGTSDAPHDDRFGLVNVLVFGGAPDRHPHVPVELGKLAGVSIWESTGANDALPFWNTNLRDDVYLFLLHGEVRVEFKEFEGHASLGSYVGHAGDLMKLPKEVAHRTFSGDGRRRISLELAPIDPHWESLGWVADVPNFDQLELGPLRFDPNVGMTGVQLNGAHVETDSSFLLRGCRAIVAYGGHLGHNEFEGGLIISDVVDDDLDLVLFKLGAEELSFPRKDAIGLLKGLVAHLMEMDG